MARVGENPKIKYQRKTLSTSVRKKYWRITEEGLRHPWEDWKDPIAYVVKLGWYPDGTSRRYAE